MAKECETGKRRDFFSSVIQKIKNFFSSIGDKFHNLPKKSKKRRKRKGINRKDRGAIIFCACMLAYPIAQWLIFYVYGNINSVLLAFKIYDVETAQQVFLPLKDLFLNFKNVIADLFGGSGLGTYFLHGVILHGASVLIGYPIGLMFAYIIYKKFPLAKFYKVILFLPNILSSMAISMFFKYFIERAVPAWAASMGIANFPLLLMDPKYDFLTIVCYTVFFAMPGAIVINLSTMSRIPNDLIEYGRLEGISSFREFITVVLPLIYPLLEVQLLGVFVGFFTASGPLYALYAENASPSVMTFGYYMFTKVIGRNGSEAFYGYTAASNLLIGVVSVPIVYATKWLFDKFDPQVDF
ncbi:MAG: ABC transporter permease subunit [Eubacteriales bacterium]